jgi:hypothetical protein
VRRCAPATCWHARTSAADLLPPVARCAALPRSDYSGGSAPLPGHRPTTGLSAADLAGRRVGQPGNGSERSPRTAGRIGAQLFPCSLATATPQHVTVASVPLERAPTRRRPPRENRRTRTADRPRSARFRAGGSLEGVSPLVSAIRTPLRRACRARTVGQCRPVPSLSGLLPPSPASPGSGCPRLQQAAATARRRRSLTSSRFGGASWRTRSTTQRRGRTRKPVRASVRLTMVTVTASTARAQLTSRPA